jgi:hypothetical protein
LAQASWKLGYMPKSLKSALIVVLRKPGKPSYEQAKAWRPIALLSTLGKLIEKATAQKIRNAAKQYNLLPDEQMGARAQRSTATALDLLTSVIKSAWSNKGQVATLLSLDIAGAFDIVVHSRLVAVVQKLGFPQ